MAIEFYRVNEPFGCFSNFSPHGFDADGVYWPTSEHYFQAQKFAGTPYAERIRLAPKPMEAATMGRDRNHPIRPDWEDVKDDVMRRAVLLKFQANSDIRDILLSTGNEVIVEKTTDDYYWGCGTNGTGRNMLGMILMEVRQLLS